MNYIPKLQLALKQAIRALHPNRYAYSWEACKPALIAAGFEFIQPRVAIHAEKRIVVKYSFMTVSPPKEAVPTQLLHIVSRTMLIVLQPLCRRLPSDRQANALAISNPLADAHRDNVCKFRGRPALFDW